MVETNPNPNVEEPKDNNNEQKPKVQLKINRSQRRGLVKKFKHLNLLSERYKQNKKGIRKSGAFGKQKFPENYKSLKVVPRSQREVGVNCDEFGIKI